MRARLAFTMGVGCVLALTACSTAATPPPEHRTGASVEESVAPTAEPSAAAPSSSEPPRVESVAEVIDIHGGPDWPIEGFGSLWMLATDSEDPAVVRFDPNTSSEIARIPLPGRTCQAMTVSEDAVWVCTPDGLARIDPGSDAIIDVIPFPVTSWFGRLAASDDAIWALGGAEVTPRSLIRIDPGTATVTEIPLGHRGGAVAFGFDAVWVTAPASGALLRVDPLTLTVSEHATGLVQPLALAVGPDAVWVGLHGLENLDRAADDPTLARIDPVSGVVTAEIATGEPVIGIWAASDRVWLRAFDRFLVGIDPTTNAIVEAFGGPGSYGDVTVAFGSVWATAADAYKLYRISR